MEGEGEGPGLVGCRGGLHVLARPGYRRRWEEEEEVEEEEEREEGGSLGALGPSLERSPPPHPPWVSPGLLLLLLLIFLTFPSKVSGRRGEPPTAVWPWPPPRACMCAKHVGR